MPFLPQILLLSSVVAVGVLHTIVPDHWVPITLMARQQGWSKKQTARAALTAGTGHVVTTLIIAVIVWIAGVAFATQFGNLIDVVSSIALIAFGGWIAIASLLEMQGEHTHTHDHDHHENDDHDHTHDHGEGRKKRTALLLILGSSPMIEGIPAFFAAGKYGLGLIIPMALLFAASTIATYVLLSVYSASGLQQVRFAAFEKYGEVVSGAFIALIGAIFLIWPVL